MIKQLYKIADEVVEDLTKQYYAHQEQLSNRLGQVVEQNRQLMCKRQLLLERMREGAQRAHSIYLEAAESINGIPSLADDEAVA